MTFKQIDKLPHSKGLNNRRGKVQLMIEEFINSGIQYAEVHIAEKEYVSVYSAMSSISKSIRGMHMTKVVKVQVIDQRLYISRVEIGE